MSKCAITTAVAAGALAALFVHADWAYEGQWGTPGSGDGQFNYPSGVAVAPNGNVSLNCWLSTRLKVFTFL